MKRTYNRTLGVWFAILFLFAGCGVGIIGFAQFMRSSANGGRLLGSSQLRELVFDGKSLDAALGTGVLITLSALAALYGIVTHFSAVPLSANMTAASAFAILRTRLRGLYVFNGILLGTSLVTLVMGLVVWFATLQQRSEYEAIFVAQAPQMQQWIQDSLQCCGYWNATSTGHFAQATGFCASPAVAANATAIQGCVAPITDFTDLLMNTAFTTLFGVVALEAALFVATWCVIHEKEKYERCRRILSKGGHTV